MPRLIAKITEIKRLRGEIKSLFIAALFNRHSGKSQCKKIVTTVNVKKKTPWP